MRHIITERMCGFLVQTSICWRTMSRRTRIIHELASRSTSKRFIHSRKGMSVIYSLGELNMVKMPNVSSSTVSVCLCGRRYTSDMKNDEMVRVWMSEIKDDFEKEKNLKPDTKAKNEVTRGGTDRLASDFDVDKLNEVKKTTSEKDNVDLDENWNTSAVTSEKAEDFIEPDVHGFTTEEMIELVKQARTSQTTGDSDERTTAEGDDDYDDNDETYSSSSDSNNDDDDDSSSSSSDSDSDDSKDGTKEAENKVKF